MLFAALALTILAAPAAPSGKNAFTPAEVFAQADLMTAASNFDAAEALIRDGMRTHPGASGFHYALGKVLLARARQADAFYELHYEVLRTGPVDFGLDAAKKQKEILDNGRGFEVDEVRTYQRALNRLDAEPASVKQTLEGIQKQRGQRFTLRFFIAEATLRSRDFEGALRSFRELTKEDPGFIPAIVLEAMALRALGRQSEAEAVAARAKKLDAKHWSLEPLELLSKPLPPIPAAATTPPAPKSQ